MCIIIDIIDIFNRLENIYRYYNSRNKLVYDNRTVHSIAPISHSIYV